MTKVHRVEILIVDHDDLGADGIRQVLESTRYPNHCISPQVAAVQTREVDWTDGHPLNQKRSWRAAFAALFANPPQQTQAAGYSVFICVRCGRESDSPCKCNP